MRKYSNFKAVPIFIEDDSQINSYNPIIQDFGYTPIGDFVFGGGPQSLDTQIGGGFAKDYPQSLEVYNPIADDSGLKACVITHWNCADNPQETIQIPMGANCMDYQPAMPPCAPSGDGGGGTPSGGGGAPSTDGGGAPSIGGGIEEKLKQVNILLLYILLLWILIYTIIDNITLMMHYLLK